MENPVIVSNLGNTLGNTGLTYGTVILSGQGQISLSQGSGSDGKVTIGISAPSIAPIATTVQVVGSANSVGTATRYAAEDHVHAGLQSINVGGNTAGQSSSGAGSVMLAGGPNITLSGATVAGGMTLSISAAAGAGGAFSAGISTQGDTFGTTGLVGSQMLLVGSNGIALSQSVNGASATLSIQDSPYISSWQPIGISSQTQAFLNNSICVESVAIFKPVSASVAILALSISTGLTTLSTYAVDVSINVGIYTRSASSISLASSGSQSFRFSGDSAGGQAGVAGAKLYTVPISINATPGLYYLGVHLASSTTNSNGATVRVYNASTIAPLIQAYFGDPLGAVSIINGQMGYGVRSASSSNLPVSIAFSDIGAANLYWIGFANFTA